MEKIIKLFFNFKIKLTSLQSNSSNFIYLFDKKNTPR